MNPANTRAMVSSHVNFVVLGHLSQLGVKKNALHARQEHTLRVQASPHALRVLAVTSMTRKVPEVATMNARKEKSSRYPDRPNVLNVNRDHTVTLKASANARSAKKVTTVRRKVQLKSVRSARWAKSSPRKDRPNVPNVNRDHTATKEAPSNARSAPAVRTQTKKVLRSVHHVHTGSRRP